jgi:hypothetical protein
VQNGQHGLLWRANHIFKNISITIQYIKKNVLDKNLLKNVYLRYVTKQFQYLHFAHAQCWLYLKQHTEQARWQENKMYNGLSFLMQQAIMPKEKTGDYYCLHYQNLMLTSNTSLPDGCACLRNQSFLVKLSKGIAVESSSQWSHNLPNSVLINVDVTAMAMKKSLILQLIKLNAVLTCTMERWCPLICTHMHKNEGCICVKQTFLLLPLSCPF